MTHSIDYTYLTKNVTAITKEVSGFIKNNAGKLRQEDIEEKGLHDMVSYVDRGSEEMIKKALKELLPEAGFIAEESGNDLAARFNWIIDPLDGTTNFVHGVPLYSISIALQEAGEIVLGVVHEVNLDECFYAWKGGTAYCNGQEIKVSKTEKLDASLIATGFPYYDFTRMEPYLKVFDQLMRNSRGIRRLGSAAVDLAYVACGRFEVFYEYGLHPWDVAAGAFIVAQAGGKLSGFDGTDDVIFGKDIIASNGIVHDEMLSIIIKNFKTEINQ